MRGMIKRILQRVKEDCGSVNLLARDLDSGRETVEAILERAVREKYLERVSISSDCSTCPIGSKCEGELSKCDGVEMYILTSKGREYVE